MLHPVGNLPAAVYWRRRALVLIVLLSVLGGGGWLAVAGIGRWRAQAAVAAASSTVPPISTPALDQVVPSLAGVQIPASTRPSRSVSAGPCTDDMITVSVRAPASAAVGSTPTLELVVTNTAPVPCMRALDKGLQELVLLDAVGTRIWSSNDCVPSGSSDVRTLAAGEAVAFPLVWGGVSSEPTCTAPGVPPPPGRYVVRGRLGTRVSADAPLALT